MVFPGYQLDTGSSAQSVAPDAPCREAGIPHHALHWLDGFTAGRSCKGFGQIWLYSLFLHFLLLFYFREFQYFAYISLTTCPNAVILVQPQSPILSAHFIFLSVT